MSQLAVPAAGYAVLAGSGVAAAASAQDALFGAAAAALVLLFVGIHNAWDSIASSAERRKKASDEGYLRLVLALAGLRALAVRSPLLRLPVLEEAALLSRGWSLPKVAEPVRCQLGITDGMLDIFMTEIMLQGAGIVSIVGKLIAACVTQHVRMDGEWHLGGLTKALDKPMKADGAHRPAALRIKHIGI